MTYEIDLHPAYSLRAVRSGNKKKEKSYKSKSKHTIVSETDIYDSQATYQLSMRLPFL